jgi:type I restriction enzyme S subunit
VKPPPNRRPLWLPLHYAQAHKPSLRFVPRQPNPQKKEQHQENYHASLPASFSPYCSLIKGTKTVQEMLARRDTSTIRFKAKPGLSDLNYLKFWLDSDEFRGQITRLVTGSAQQNFGPSHLKSIHITLPPLEKQTYIARRLNKADRLRRTRRYTLELTDTFLPAAFIELFGNARDARWDRSTLGELTLDFSYGTSTKCSDNSALHAVLRIPNIIRGTIDTTDLKFGELTPNEQKKLQLKHGDLLFVRTNGNPDYVGRCAVFDLKAELYFASYLIRARTDQKLIAPVFLAAYLRMPDGRRSMQPSIRTTAGQYNVSIEGLRDVQVIVPPLPLQQKFAALVERVERLRAVQREALRQAEHLFQRLLHGAFSESA